LSAIHSDMLTIARRYGAAIFALALEGKNAAETVAQITVLAEAIAGHEPLREALSSPLVTPAQKRATLAALTKNASPLTQRAIETMAQGGRASLIPAVAADLQKRLAAHQGEVEATITSARALPAATQKQLAGSLASATGKKVNLKLKEDASVLGGLMIELGSLRLDATLSGALNTMRQQLLTAAH
jgi:F-type H+-transporting ATPase subunit delta